MSAPGPGICAAAGRPGARWSEATRDATQSRVWRLEGAGPTVYVKVHRTPGKYRRERVALQALAGRDLAPALLRFDDALRVLVIAECPGEAPGADPVVDGPAWRAAGAALAAAHRLPCPADPLPLDVALARRLDGWRSRAARWLPAAVVRGLADRVHPAAFAGAGRVFCHRDYAPRNWRVAGGRCRMFDLEHAGPDAPEADWVEAWAADRDGALLAAFAAGYGRRPDPERLETLLALHALGTATWGRQHDDPAYIARGDRLMRRLLGP